MNDLLQDPIITSSRQSTPGLHHIELSTLLGHPHEQASPQLTEPFWQQAPEVAYPHARFYPEFNLYTEDHLYYAYPDAMDTTVVVIGRKSRFARPAGDANGQPKRPRETVKVWLEDELVGEISLGVLVRFSKLAKVTYPKPAQPKDQASISKDGAKLNGETALVDALEARKGEKKTWADMAEQSETEKASETATEQADIEDDVATTTVASPSSQSVATSEPPAPKSLAIAVPGAWVQPRIGVVKHILTWMEQNKRSRNNEPLLPLTPAPLPKIYLKALVDTYTGVLAYDLAPFPHDLRHEILTRITQQPAQAEQIRYIYEHLPVQDPILNRLVTSFFEHDDAGRYSTEEVDAIYGYVRDGADDGGDLERHFDRVKRSRGRKIKREDAMEKLREGFEDFAGPMREALPVADDEGKNGGQEAEGDTRRRRNRREGQAKGKAKAQ